MKMESSERRSEIGEKIFISDRNRNIVSYRLYEQSTKKYLKRE